MAYLPSPELLGLPKKYSEWRRNQDDAISKLVFNDLQVGLAVCPTGFGKCFQANTPILMFDGSVKMVQDVQDGDWLMGPDSRPRTVLNTTAGRGLLYKVVPTKGDSYTVNADHILALKLSPESVGMEHEDVLMTVENYLKTSPTFKHRAKTYRTGVQFSKREVLLDPYFVGLWLGDGSINSPSITTADREVVEYLETLASRHNLRLRFDAKKNNQAVTVFLTTGKENHAKSNPITASLRCLGISREKQLPESYRVNDEKTRLEVLAGYLDADGHLVEGVFEFSSKSLKLAEDVCFLARSLGFACYLRAEVKMSQNGTEGIYVRGTISGNTERIPTKIKRKQAAPRQQIKSVLVSGIAIEEVGVGDYFGFAVDGDHLFLLGDFTVVHNSLMYVAAGVLLGGKTIILTSTKGLQAQLMRDFGEMGMVEVKGKNSYMCPMSDNKISCEEGPCSVGYRCEYKNVLCPYYQAVAAAKASNLVVTNYAFWLHVNCYAEGIGKPGLLVCDEGHDAPSAIASFLTVEFPRSEEALVSILPPQPENLSLREWRDWAHNRKALISGTLEDHTDRIKNGEGNDRLYKQIAKLKRLIQQISSIAAMDLDNWVVDVSPMSIAFAPIDVRHECQNLLYQDAHRVVVTSGSVNYKTAELLGLDPEMCALLEYPHTFPVENRLLYHVRGARINVRASGEDLKEWLKTADSIISRRLDRKGIFHTTSYGRRDFVMAHSNYAPYMITHNRKDTINKIMEFKAAFPPKVLVSPSVSTGFDFPYEQAEYQIIGKISYPDTRSKITRARCQADPEYGAYIAMQQLVQTCGRGTRAEDDFCENFIIDDNVTWFIKRYRKFAPKWFMESYTTRIFPPQPPGKYMDRFEEEEE